MVQCWKTLKINPRVQSWRWASILGETAYFDQGPSTNVQIEASLHTAKIYIHRRGKHVQAHLVWSARFEGVWNWKSVRIHVVSRMWSMITKEKGWDSGVEITIYICSDNFFHVYCNVNLIVAVTRLMYTADGPPIPAVVVMSDGCTQHTFWVLACGFYELNPVCGQV